MSEEPKEGLVGEIEHGPSKFDQFLEQHFKKLIIGLAALALAVAGYVVLGGIKKDKEYKAGASLFGATDSDAHKEVIAQHSGTKAAATAQLLLANQQWKDGQQDEAISALSTFVSENPTHPALATARLSLGQKYVAKGKTDLAKEQFIAITGDSKGNYLGAYAHLNLGDLAKAAGNKDDARSHYEKAQTNYPNNSLASDLPSARGLARMRLETLDVAPPTPAAALSPEELLPPLPTAPQTTEPSPSEPTPENVNQEELPTEATETDPEAEAMKEEAPQSFIPEAAEGEEAAPALSEKVKQFASKLTAVNAEDEAGLNKVYEDLAKDGGSSFLYRIPFATGETGVPTAHQKALIAKLKAANPEATLVTIGYADTRGDDTLNKKLSYGRAREVASWIKGTLGTEASLESFSMGETDRFSKDDFSKNRVVEVWQITE